MSEDLRDEIRDAASMAALGVTPKTSGGVGDRVADAMEPIVARLITEAEERGAAKVREQRDREFGNLRWMDGHQQGLKDGAAKVRERVEAVLDRLGRISTQSVMEDVVSGTYQRCIRDVLTTEADSAGGES